MAPLGSHRTRPDPDHRADGEQLELLAQNAMIALLGLFDHPQVGFELLLGEERRGVETLQLLARRVSLPVGASQRQQLERTDRAGGGHVRPAAEIEELTLAVEGERLVVRQAASMCSTLYDLLQVAADLQGLVARLLDSLERLIQLDDLLHLGFDGREILLRERLVAVEIVVEPVFDGGSERQLHALVQPHHRAGHDMGRGMPHDGQRLGVPPRKHPQLHVAVGGEFVVEPYELPVNFGRNRLGGRVEPGLRGDFSRTNWPVVTLVHSVGQSNSEHALSNPSRKRIAPRSASIQRTTIRNPLGVQCVKYRLAGTSGKRTWAALLSWGRMGMAPSRQSQVRIPRRPPRQ